jgi:serine/threonine protein kinase/tetratricopeptide (TPR) repeat protein
MPGAAGTEFHGTTRFEVIRRLGAGGMGVVYEALDRERDCRVALKTVRDLGGEDLLRLKNEFRALQDLSHPNLVSLGELLEDGGRWFFTMELIDGTSFLHYVRRDSGAEAPGSAPTASGTSDKTTDVVSPSAATWQPSPARQLWEAGVTGGLRFDEAKLRSAFGQLAQALAAVHAAGMVHRDIKPSNVLVTRAGRVVLLDFGLVTGAVPSDQSTANHAVGTVAYMAPEQAASQRVGPAADWYGAGVLLYEALTGQVPFAGAPLEVMLKKQQHDPPRPSTICDGVPDDLDTLAVALLHFDPRMRPTSAEVLARLGAPAAEVRESLSSGGFTQSPPFVGRAAELAALHEAFSASRQGQAVAVVVEGESGVGKSALVRRFTEQLEDRGVVVLAGRCYEREAVPYKAVDGVVDALSRYMARLADDDATALLPRSAALLAAVFPVLRRVKAIAKAPRTWGAAKLDPQELRSRLFAGMRELFGRLADRQSLVIVVDDLQWGDADSLALLGEVLRPPEAPTFMLVTAMRLGAAATLPEIERYLPPGARRVSLGPLPQADASALAAKLLERIAPAAKTTADVVAAEAQGHPLFIDELVRHAALHGGSVDAIPRLDEALGLRVASLEAAPRRVLELAAVAGRPLPNDVVRRAAALEPEPFARAVAVLRVSSFVQSGGSRTGDMLAPYHDRVRESVTAQLGDAARRECHEALAVALEQTESADHELLAVCWRGAGDLERAADYSVRAAESADSAFAFDRAARLFASSLELRGPSHESARGLLLRMGHALANAGRGRQAAEAYLKAAEGATHADGRDLHRRAAEQYLRAGHVEEGLAALRTVLGSIGLKLAPTPRRALLSILLLRARLRLRGLRVQFREEGEVTQAELGRIDICRAVATGLGLVDNVRAAEFNVRSLLMALRAGEPTRIAVALAHEAGFFALGGGRASKRTKRLVRLARSVAERRPTPLVRGWALAAAGLAGYFGGHFRSARVAFEQAIENFRAARSEGVAWEIDAVQNYLLFILVYLGELAEARVLLPRLVAEAQDHGDLFAATNLRLSILNLAWLLDDDAANARRIADAASKGWPRTGFHVQHWYELTAQTHLDLYEGSAQAAHDRVAAAWKPLAGSMLLRVQLVGIEALHLRARANLALALADPPRRPGLLRAVEQDARRIFREKMAWSNPLAELLLAGVAETRGDHDTALRRCGVAATGFDSAEMALYAAVARRRQGQLLAGDEGRAMVAAADAWMVGQKIKSPARWAAMLAPGFPD